MADESPGQERTESPTPRRRQQARDEGRIARSPELAAAATVLAGTAALALAGEQALSTFAMRSLREGARALSAGPIGPAGLTFLLQTHVLGMLAALAPFALAAAGAAVLVNVAQTGGLVSTRPLAPKLSNLNPLAGLRRLVGLDGVIGGLRSLLKLIALSVVTALVLAHAWPELMALPNVEVTGTALVLRALSVRLAITVGLAFLVLAAADFGVQRLRHERRLRMTHNEVRREHRDTEGDPSLKARILSIARARARQRMLQRVPTADVVIVNPVHVAVALRYDVTAAPAPIVVAMGERKLAERIRDLARRHGVPVIENRAVARALLATARVGRMIPPALYAAIAEILAFVYRQRHGAPRAGERREVRP